jgi:hypothetical protein
MTHDGKRVGTIKTASGSRAHVEPSSSISKSVRRRLGWSEEGEETYELQHSAVEKFGDDEVHLKESL